MTLILNGTDNSATTPAVTGTDPDTGVYYPASNQVALATNGTLALVVDSGQRVLVGTSSQISTSTAAVQILQSANPGMTVALSAAPVSSASFTGFDGWAFDGSSYVAGATINFRAAENWSSTNHGTDIAFRNTVSGSGGALTEALRINSFGNVVLRGGTTTANGTGITFPATQSASSDANTLDDYEEGTFEAVITGSGGGTATGQAGPGSGGTYIKIGKMVYCQFYFANPTISGTISGDLRLALPFTVANATRFDNGSAGFLSTTREISSGSTSTDIRLQGSGGNAFANFRQYYIGSRTESNNLSQSTASINTSTLLWGTFNFVTT